VIEVELKAWADLAAARARLESLGKRLAKTSVKEDLYLCAPEVDPRRCDPRRDRVVRIRIEDGAVLVTAKRKKLDRDVETSEEIELAVSSAATLRALLDYMGYRPFLKKHKETASYEWRDGVHVELNRIEGLGDFVEIESLLPEGTEASEVERTRAGLVAIARELGVAERIEGRLYTDLLRERGVGLP